MADSTVAIDVLCNDGTTTAVSVPSSCTIGGLKEAVAAQSGVPPEQQRLFFNGALLLDHRTVSFYKIVTGSSVQMRQRLSASKKSVRPAAAPSGAPPLAAPRPGTSVRPGTSGGFDYDAFWKACREGKADTVRDMLVSIPNVNETQVEWGDHYNALLFAAMYGKDTVVGLLLDKGADINATTRSGRTAVALASRHGQLSTLEILLERGADVSIADKIGKLPVDVAKSSFIASLLTEHSERAVSGRVTSAAAAPEVETELAQPTAPAASQTTSPAELVQPTAPAASQTTSPAELAQPTAPAASQTTSPAELARARPASQTTSPAAKPESGASEASSGGTRASACTAAMSAGPASYPNTPGSCSEHEVSTAAPAAPVSSVPAAPVSSVPAAPVSSVPAAPVSYVPAGTAARRQRWDGVRAMITSRLELTAVAACDAVGLSYQTASRAAIVLAVGISLPLAGFLLEKARTATHSMLYYVLTGGAISLSSMLLGGAASVLLARVNGETPPWASGLGAGIGLVMGWVCLMRVYTPWLVSAMACTASTAAVAEAAKAMQRRSIFTSFLRGVSASAAVLYMLFGVLFPFTGEVCMGHILTYAPYCLVPVLAGDAFQLVVRQNRECPYLRLIGTNVRGLSRSVATGASFTVHAPRGLLGEVTLGGVAKYLNGNGADACERLPPGPTFNMGSMLHSR